MATSLTHRSEAYDEDQVSNTLDRLRVTFDDLLKSRQDDQVGVLIEASIEKAFYTGWEFSSYLVRKLFLFESIAAALLIDIRNYLRINGSS